MFDRTDSLEFYVADDDIEILHTHEELADLNQPAEGMRGADRCLSCERWTHEHFCTKCVERSKQRLLIPELDDLGVAG